MNGIDKLKRARDILEIELTSTIISSELNVRLKRFHVILRDGTEIFVQYNDHEEYSYSIIFTHQELDRVRFDNFDDLWNVSSKPHHVHPRYSESGAVSVMTGDPDKDMIHLAKYIKTLGLDAL